jgi:hypothetical protein
VLCACTQKHEGQRISSKISRVDPKACLFSRQVLDLVLKGAVKHAQDLRREVRNHAVEPSQQLVSHLALRRSDRHGLSGEGRQACDRVVDHKSVLLKSQGPFWCLLILAFG